MCYVLRVVRTVWQKDSFPLTDPVYGAYNAARPSVCEWRLLVLRRESLAFTRTFYEFDEIEPLRRSPNVPSCARAGHVAVVPAIRSPRQPEVVRFRRQGETIVAVRIRLAVLGRDLYVEVMHDVGEEQEQRGARQLLAQTASLAWNRKQSLAFSQLVPNNGELIIFRIPSRRLKNLCNMERLE